MRLRHVKRGAAGDAGAVAWLGHYLVTQPLEGLNGAAADWTGDYELRLGEEGRFSLTLPNAAGGDGVLHRRRFSILTDPGYEAGDEWIEVYEGHDVGGDPVFVGTPTEKEVTRSKVSLSGFDVMELGKTIRETAAGFWRHAPREAWEHYAGTWEAIVHDDFADGIDPDVWGTAGNVQAVNGHARLTYRTAGILPAQAAVIGIFPRASSGNPVPGAVRQPRTAAEAWRVEAHFEKLPNGGVIELHLQQDNAGFTDPDDPEDGDSPIVLRATASPTGGVISATVESDPLANVKAANLTPGAGLRLAIEARDRWVLFYVNGELVHATSSYNPPGLGVPETLLTPTIVHGVTGVFQGSVDLVSVLVRQWRPLMLLADGGDHVLPGDPGAAGAGLLAEYFDDRDLTPLTAAARVSRLFSPTRTPVARRVETTLARTLTGLPAGVTTENVSARWSGSIRLPLDTADVRFRVTNLDDRARLWVGRTRHGDQLLEDWTSAGHPAATLGPSAYVRDGWPALPAVAGWFPLVLEWSQGAGAGGVTLEYETTANPGVWTTVGAGSLPVSPIGVYQATVRGDSFYEQLRGLVDTFGYQARVIPRPLGHPGFPGELAPRVRQGRDTDKVIDDVTNGEPVVKANSRDVVHSLTADAAGIAAEGAQLTLEQIDFDRVGDHPIFNGDAISLAELSYPALVAQRLRTLQTLRRSAWEEVAVQPDGATDLVDAFGLTGALARFRWEPGDAVRLAFDEVDVADDLPRQITAVRRAIAPEQHGDPEVSFRPRPRNTRAQLRRVARQQAAARRNYQGQLVERTGSVGGWGSPTVAGSIAGGDAFSRVALPDDLDSIIGADLVVQWKGDATSPWGLEVNGVAVAGVTITTVGAYPITALVARDAARPRMYARATPAAGAASSIEYTLRLVIRL